MAKWLGLFVVAFVGTIFWAIVATSNPTAQATSSTPVANINAQVDSSMQADAMSRKSLK